MGGVSAATGVPASQGPWRQYERALAGRPKSKSQFGAVTWVRAMVAGSWGFWKTPPIRHPAGVRGLKTWLFEGPQINRERLGKQQFKKACSGQS